MRRSRGGTAVAIAMLSGLTIMGCAVSTQQEIRIGQQNVQQINRQLPIVKDPEINRYINVLGDSIAKLTSRGADLPWTFFVVDSKEVNAFAVPGGYIYVNRGLIERAEKMDQLAGVLGHEIGHVVMRHSVKQMQQSQGTGIGVALACVLTRVCNSGLAQPMVQVGGTAVFAKFSRGDEAEADEVGIDNVVRAGISPNGMPEMFQILINERKSNPGAVDAWFSTHPIEEDRIADTKAKVALINPAILQTLTVDSPGFQSFKSRVMALPPSPAPRGR